MRIKRARSTKTDTVVDDTSFKSSHYNNTNFHLGHQAIREADQEDDYTQGESSLRGSVQSNSFRNSFVVGLQKGLRKSIKEIPLKASDTAETNLIKDPDTIIEGDLFKEQIQEFQNNFFREKDLEKVEEADCQRETDPKILNPPLQLEELQADDHSMPSLIKKIERLQQLQRKQDPKHRHMFKLCPSVSNLPIENNFARSMMMDGDRDVLAEKRKRVSEIYLGQKKAAIKVENFKKKVRDENRADRLKEAEANKYALDQAVSMVAFLGNVNVNPETLKKLSQKQSLAMIRKFMEDTIKVNQQSNLSELQKQVNQSIFSKLQNQERALVKQIGDNDRPLKSFLLNKQVTADQMSVTVAAKIQRLAAFDRLSQTLKPPTLKAKQEEKKANKVQRQIRTLLSAKQMMKQTPKRRNDDVVCTLPSSISRKSPSNYSNFEKKQQLRDQYLAFIKQSGRQSARPANHSKLIPESQASNAIIVKMQKPVLTNKKFTPRKTTGSQSQMVFTKVAPFVQI